MHSMQQKLTVLTWLDNWTKATAEVGSRLQQSSKIWS